VGKLLESITKLVNIYFQLIVIELENNWKKPLLEVALAILVTFYAKLNTAKSAKIKITLQITTMKQMS